MSRHEGVSCDSCLKSNFGGRRYKCLICYDYDLCADCYEEGATSTRHSSDHPMQCILTRADIDLYYGGEMLNSEQPLSFTCPYCKKMGFSDSALLEHVGAEHTDTGLEVVCPVCAGLPGGDPNLVTDDFAGHLTLEHRTGPRDLISFLDEPSAIRHGGVRRIPGRALGGPRSRRSNMHFSSSSGLSAISPSGRESVDPIAELLSQLSGVRRGAPQPSQLQQLQMQIQLERQQVSATRQQLERLPRRTAHPVASSSNSNAPMQELLTSVSGAGGSCHNPGLSSISTSQQPQSSIVSSINTREIPITASSLPLAVTSVGLSALHVNSSSDVHAQLLLTRFMTPILDENELTQQEKDQADRSQYVQAVMLSTLSTIKPDECYENSGENSQDEKDGETNVNKEDQDDRNNENQNLNSGESGEALQTLDKTRCQRTSPPSEDEFLEECTLQQQHMLKKLKKSLGAAGKSGSSQNTAMVLERRARSSPPAQHPQQTKPARESKPNSGSAKEIPDSR